MYFTKDDFKKIEEWLRTHSIKESEFDNINIIQGNEYITAVQNGINKRICLKDFIKAIADKISSGVLNVSLLYDKESITLEEVLPLIVERVSGQIITFLNPDGYWEMWQFTGDVSQWNNIELWQNVYAIFDYENAIRTAVSEVKATKEEIFNYKENTNTIVSQYKEDFDSKTKFYDNELKKFEGKQKEHISTTTQQLSNFDTTIQTYTGKVEESNAKVDTFETQIGVFDSKVNTFDSKITTFETKTIPDKFTDLDNKYEEHKEFLTELHTDFMNDVNEHIDINQQIALGKIDEKIVEVKTELDTELSQEFSVDIKNRIDEYSENIVKRVNNIETLANTKMSKQDNAEEGNIAIFENGTVVDSNIEASNVAKQNGYYESMIVGASRNLAGNNIVTAKYTYRPTADTTDVADGVAKISSVKGNTIVWNQLDKNCGPYNRYGIILTPNDDDTFTLNGTATTNFEIYNIENNGAIYKSLPTGHKGLFKLNHISGEFTTDIRFIYGETHIPINAKKILLTKNNYRYLSIRLNEGCVIDNAKFSFQLFDLTQMFGEGNEPTIEEFEAMFPNDYYEYNEGELKSIEDFQIKSVGFNQWDEEWEVGMINGGNGLSVESKVNIRTKNFIRVIPNSNYYFNIPSINGSYMGYCMYYDSSKNFVTYVPIGPNYHSAKLIPNNVHYIRFYVREEYGTIYKNDINVNLSHSGIRNGEYEPYREDILPINISTIKDENGEVLFPNGLCSAGEAHDELVYDKAIGKWKAVKRIGSVDMGTLNWTYYDVNYNPNSFPYGFFTTGDVYRERSLKNIVSTKYPFGSYTKDKTMLGNASNQAIYIIDSAYTDAAALKASLQGQILYYELQTPIEVILDDFTSNYKVSDWGTEEILMNSTPIIPVIYDVEYALNAVDTLRNMPTNYISKESLDAFLSTLGSAMGGTWTATYNETNGRYDFTFSANASATELINE